MTPRDAAIKSYADAERRMLVRARSARGTSVLTAIKLREKAIAIHRAMENELLDPEPLHLRKTA